ncbi:MAG: hypothetical protein O6852_00575 [Gammaproteobacteria bacterium]|nr:hypothetical protein [Gammaproteobacteria bacterium]
MNKYRILCRISVLLVLLMSLTSCVVLLLNGHLSHGYYVSPSESFKCKLPGGAFSRQLKITDRSNAIGETVTFKLEPGLLWRIDHLHLVHHELANFDSLTNRREQLEVVKFNYFKNHLLSNLEIAEIKSEQYKQINEVEVLIVYAYLQWDNAEDNRELLFSIDGDYLNVLHYAQNISENLQTITSGVTGLYKSCQF